MAQPSTQAKLWVTLGTVVANIVYAGLRAKGDSNGILRLVAFCSGFPMTMLSYTFVDEGCGSLYGIKVQVREPRKGRSDQRDE